MVIYYLVILPITWRGLFVIIGFEGYSKKREGSKDNIWLKALFLEVPQRWNGWLTWMEKGQRCQKAWNGVNWCYRQRWSLETSI